MYHVQGTAGAEALWSSAFITTSEASELYSTGSENMYLDQDCQVKVEEFDQEFYPPSHKK